MTQLVITSFEKKPQAIAFAKKLLAEKLAACCSIFPGATSLYKWKGKKVTAGEVFLLIKTTPTKLKALQKFFKAHHPYELPEFLTLKAGASQKFGAWIESQVK